MMAYDFSRLPPGTVFDILTDEGTIELTSRGPGRKWLDVTLKGEAAILLCFYESYRGDFDKFRESLEARGGMMEAAATEIRDQMTGVIMFQGDNFPFTIMGVSLK